MTDFTRTTKPQLIKLFKELTADLKRTGKDWKDKEHRLNIEIEHLRKSKGIRGDKNDRVQDILKVHREQKEFIKVLKNANRENEKEEEARKNELKQLELNNIFLERLATRTAEELADRNQTVLRQADKITDLEAELKRAKK